MSNKTWENLFKKDPFEIDPFKWEHGWIARDNPKYPMASTHDIQVA